MTATRILCQSDVKALLDMPLAIDAVERAFVAHGRGEAIMPHKIYLDLPSYQGDFRAMPAYLSGSAGVKWVNSHPQNPALHNLPSVLGLYILSDPKTALPLAIMDATYLTAARTGAAAAVASKYLSRRQKTLGLIGAGVQAHFFVAAHRARYPDIEVFVFDTDQARTSDFCRDNNATAATLDTAASCDIVCTATPSRRPIIELAQLRPGAHINAMGADAPGKQELDPAILREAQCVIDDYDQALESGEVNVPLRQGLITRSDIDATLGDVLIGRKARNERPFSVFDSTGLAVQDLTLARAIYDKAKAQGRGHTLDLRA